MYPGPESDLTLFCPQARRSASALPLPNPNPQAAQKPGRKTPALCPSKERESPEASPAVHTALLLVFPESNCPFVNFAISQSARSISSDSHSICSSHSPEGWVGAVPAPSLGLPLPHVPSASLDTLITWSPGSTSSSSTSLVLALLPMTSAGSLDNHLPF